MQNDFFITLLIDDHHLSSVNSNNNEKGEKILKADYYLNTMAEYFTGKEYKDNKINEFMIKSLYKIAKFEYNKLDLNKVKFSINGNNEVNISDVLVNAKNEDIFSQSKRLLIKLGALNLDQIHYQGQNIDSIAYPILETNVSESINGLEEKSLQKLAEKSPMYESPFISQKEVVFEHLIDEDQHIISELTDCWHTFTAWLKKLFCKNID